MIQLDRFDSAKLDRARSIVRDLGSVLVAYSGGVDSTLLLKVGLDELGPRAVAVLASSPAYPESEQEQARETARSLGLSNWNKPSFACLSSRIPHGTHVTVEALRRIEAAEAAIKALGSAQVRVRDHGDVARIEVEPAEIDRLTRSREAVVEALRRAGYTFVALDLEGYATGSLNRTRQPDRS